MKPHALVTGASRGIGAAIACELAKAGHPVIINYRADEAGAKRVQAQIQAAGGQAELLQFDVADERESERALEQVAEREIGVVVNNAGITADGPFPAMNHDEWSRVLRVTLDGFYHVTRPLIMPMVRRRWGRVVNVASVSGLVGNRGQTNYSAAKAGLIGATRSLAMEVAKRRITVNAVAPGLIETDMLTGAPVDEILPHIPMRRLGKPEEVAAVVGFLVSEGASYVTGQVIAISGGLG